MEEGKPPRIDYSRCIDCFRCAELCPKDAFYAKEKLVGKVLKWMRKRVKL